MQVTILNVISREPESHAVDFATQFGMGRAEWYGDFPRLFHSYGVEFEIEEDLVWGDNIVEIKKIEGHNAINYHENILILYGQLESIDSDGFANIRVGDSIMTVGALGVPPALGAFVQIRPKKLVLYPHDEYGVVLRDIHSQQAEIQSGLIRTSKVNDRIVLNLLMQPKDVFSPATYQQFLQRYGNVQLEYSRLYELHLRYEPHERRKSPERQQMVLLKEQFNSLRQEYLRRLPIHLLAQCPYCSSRILQPVDSFSLIGFYPLINILDFYQSSEAWVTNLPPPRQCCRHAIVATVSVNLNNLIPDDLPSWALQRKWGKLDAAPRVMVWPLIARQTSVVIHALPIGRLDDPEPIHRYTAYFVTYFANDATNLYTEDMWVPTDVGRPATEGVLYDLDLVKWVKARRLFWLDPDDSTRLVRGPVEVFPYANIQPQGWYKIVENGQINGPYTYHKVWQGEAPFHDKSFPKTIE